MRWLILLKDAIIFGLRLLSRHVVIPLLDALYAVLRTVPDLVGAIADLLDEWANYWDELSDDDAGTQK